MKNLKLAKTYKVLDLMKLFVTATITFILVNNGKKHDKFQTSTEISTEKKSH